MLKAVICLYLVGVLMFAGITIYMISSSYSSHAQVVEEKTQTISKREDVVVFRPTEEVTMRLPYKPELLIKKKDLTGSAFLVNIIIYKTYYEMAEALLKYDGSSYPTLWGWQTNRNGVCEIHVVEPKFVRGGRILSTWGHELGHCVYGRFHK